MKSIEEKAEEYVNQEKTTLRDLSTIQKIALKSHLIDFAKQAVNSKLEEIDKKLLIKWNEYQRGASLYENGMADGIDISQDIVSLNKLP